MFGTFVEGAGHLVQSKAGTWQRIVCRKLSVVAMVGNQRDMSVIGGYN
jgi:hypothetical protein